MPGGRWTAKGGGSDGDTTERMAGRAGGMYEERKVKTVKDTLGAPQGRRDNARAAEQSLMLPGQEGMAGLGGHTIPKAAPQAKSM